MIRGSKNNREKCIRENAFEQKIKNPGLKILTRRVSASRPSNNRGPGRQQRSRSSITGAPNRAGSS